MQQQSEAHHLLPSTVNYWAGRMERTANVQYRGKNNKQIRTLKNPPPRNSLPSQIVNPYTSNCKASLLTHAGHILA